MKVLLVPAVICVLFGICFGNDVFSGQCLNNVHGACSSTGPDSVVKELNSNSSFCRSTFGGFPQLADKTQLLAQKQIQASMQMLLVGCHFSEWNVDRKGFFKLFMDLSDAQFQDAVTLIQHMVDRGGRLVNFTVPMIEEGYQLGELVALSKALDIEKGLASRTLNLAHAATHGDVKTNQHTDSEFSHFLADRVSDKHSIRIKTLANHVNTLSQAVTHALAKTGDPAFALHIFDTQVLSG